MPLVPAVTELVIAELLYLNYESESDPITMYINSSGTTTATGQMVGFETEDTRTDLRYRSSLWRSGHASISGKTWNEIFPPQRHHYA